ncbi:phenylalanine--tRNA ligase subunit beta, partial [Patescibacteria group bacterium]|nr:phenylalanine--tRNA ligase subunit beta [Patescibacteria group bacterium]MBU1754692.1 phenylalanine--tRNA ligase subunit beta [Patescibacteria group bacterium]
KWLQTYFDTPLPSIEEVSDALTFHAFEIDEAEGDVLDVNVLPDRAAYGLSHRGVALEVSAALNMPMKSDPLREAVPELPSTNTLSVQIENEEKCLRYMGALVTGVTVGPSPAWLKEALESLGQRSINNVVDATNYVMLNIGQPLHAFDASKLSKNTDGAYEILVRGAYEGEKITTLSGDEYILPEDTLLITDKVADVAIGIAGVKGGKVAEVDANTTDIILEAATFDGTSIRKTAQALKLWTDASLRFQNKISADLVAYGMRDVVKLILDIAGGELVGSTDLYPQPETVTPVSVSLDQINAHLGTQYSGADVESALTRLGFIFTSDAMTYTVTPAFERRDLVLPQDLIEEVGRTIGYDTLPLAELPPISGESNQTQYRCFEHIKDVLIERGYTEISTQSFAAAGDIELANPLDMTKPYLRPSLETNMRTALTHAKNIAPRVLGPDEAIKLFELGSVFEQGGEHFSLALGYVQLRGKQSKTMLEETLDALKTDVGISVPSVTDDGFVEINLSDNEVASTYTPARVSLGAYQPYSVYPFALRDVAVWTPEGTEESRVLNAILEKAGDLVARIDLFDRFEKEGRISFAFRLVFEAPDRTLSDEDLNPIMDAVYANLKENEGWEIR